MSAPPVRPALSPHAPSPHAGVAVALALLPALLGLLANLPAPFEWDQTSFMLGGERLGEGGVIYRDWWDVKQPGVLWFFALGGRLFGYDEVGAHALELLWQTGLALAVLALLWRDDRRAAVLAPACAVGVYAAVAGPWHLTQAEILVALPLALCLLALEAHRPDRTPGAGRFALAGLAAGVALLFKLVFVPIPAAFALLAARERARRHGIASTLAPLALFALAAAAPSALAVVQVARAGALDALVRAWFAEPAAMLSAVRGTRIATLLDGITWFALRFAPVLALALVGAWARRDRLAAMLLAWAATGALVVLAQRTSWWQYHWLLIAVPLGVLAARGASVVIEQATARGVRRRVVAAALALVFVGPLALLAAKWVLLAADDFAWTAAARRAHQLRQSELYRRIADDAEFLSAADAQPGPIVVVGDPAVYWVTGRREPLSPPGIRFFERYDTDDWAVLAEQIEATRPAYVHVQTEFLAAVERPVFNVGEPLRAVLARDYVERQRGARGAWWQRRAPAAPH